MLAWICAVLVGEEPTLASSYHVPFGISDFRYGQECGCAARTSRPPASHTTVTISFGGSGRWASGRSASVIGEPSGAVYGKCSSFAAVGAMPTDVTGRFTAPCAGMNPGPYQSIGTCWT